MKSLLENILDDDKTVEKDLNFNSQKMLVDKLKDKFLRLPAKSRSAEKKDVYGRTIHVGDIVLTSPNFRPCFVRNLGLEGQREIGLYDPVTKENIYLSIFSVFRLDDPHELLKSK